MRRRLRPMASNTNELVEMVEREGELEARRVVAMGATLARAAGWDAEPVLKRTWGPKDCAWPRKPTKFRQTWYSSAPGARRDASGAGQRGRHGAAPLPATGGRGAQSDAGSRVRRAAEGADGGGMGRLGRLGNGVGGGQTPVPGPGGGAGVRRRR
ncbi:hypothetical protein I551_1017 [Mycobacterium ulcerans str. Harvey]|uniref:Uncharacterized protein n=1 Tax=Mycobacterium ulcerans str. Harvey TaxID=1299332 RepID=A0ABN0R600_MYCUL|nr:hypothetical protein I551_1017 [Mycobacterium ulcerans str. Harvey]